MADSQSEQTPRFRDYRKLVPVAFVLFTMSMLYCIFLSCHLLPSLAEHEHDSPARVKVVLEAVLFHLITSLVVLCYARCVTVHPGAIPENDMHWEFVAYDSRAPQIDRTFPLLNLQETKRTGSRRNCKWCQKFKPDRCHHCRVCKRCTLKMDHHCPWIYNCVGFGNYKYFFLLLFYSVLDLHLISVSLSSSVRAAVRDEDTPFVQMFLALFGWTLSSTIGILMTIFWCFHIWLCSKSLTTIEFCEKRAPRKAQLPESGKQPYDHSVYNLGAIGNLKATLGDNVLLMLLPFSPPSGDGLDFVSSSMRLNKGFDMTKSGRRMTHQPTQRPVNWEGAPPHLPEAASEEEEGQETSGNAKTPG